MESNLPYSRYQDQIYLQGLAGKKPSLPIAVEALEDQARAKLTREAYDYVAGGAGSEDAMRANLDALKAWRIVPRMLRDVSVRRLHTEILGERMPAPILLAPIGVQGIIRSEAEAATARAAAGLGIHSILSTASSKSIEEVAQASGDGPRWFQLYWPRRPELAESLLERARRSGYSAIVLTLDTRLLGFRERDLSNAYNPFLKGQGLANYFSDPIFRSALAAPPEENPQAAILHFVENFSSPGCTWEDLELLCRQTPLPVILKGILHGDDALRGLDCGAKGFIVSNHGGRQVDGAVASLRALPDVAAAVGDQAPVLFDSGIRRGADIFKALALGAKAVLVGRPYVWGLALEGEAGVREVLLRLAADLDLTMALSGCRSLDDINMEMLLRESLPIA